MMSSYRIIRLIKKYKSIQEKQNKISFMVGFNSFISYFFLIISLKSTSLTNIVFVAHLFPFLLLVNHSISKSSNLSIHQLVSLFLYIICFFIILIPALFRDPGPGIGIYLLSIIFKFVANKTVNDFNKIDVDLLMLNIGFYNVFFGGILMIIFFDKMEYISKFMWFLIFLNALTSYFMKIFLNKVLKYENNEPKLMILNIIILAFVIPIDYFIFDQIFYKNYLVLLFSFIEIFFLCKDLKKGVKSKNNI